MKLIEVGEGGRLFESNADIHTSNPPLRQSYKNWSRRLRPSKTVPEGIVL